MGQNPPGANSRSNQNPADIALADLLAELGFGGSNEAIARQALEEAALTRPGRQGVAASKRDRVIASLRGRFALICPRQSCQRAAPETRKGRTQLCPERLIDCEVCGGSDNRLAVDRLCAALQRRGIRKVVVLGGSPSARANLSELVGDRLQLRLVDGVTRRTRVEARSDLLWADLVLVWGGTQLDHKVSLLYTGAGDERVVSVHRRGIAALVEELLMSPRAS